MNNSKNNILSLFSGGGFLDLGFINNGFQIDGACEIVPEFITSYNYGVSAYLKNTKKKK